MGGGHHLCLFGIPELRDPAGRLVRLRTRKQLALLVYLALEARTRPASRDRLVQLFWADAPEPKARHSLSQALTAIRGVLGGDAVRPTGGSVLLAGTLTTDLEVRTWAETPVEVAHPLRELETCAGPDFGHWVDGARERCLRAARSALAEAIERARSRGDVAAVHERAETLYAVDSASDVAAHVLAERALLTGDSAGAIRFLRDHLRKSQEELGCIPHPDIKRLLRRIESGAPLETAVAGPADAAAPRMREEVFVGREAELAQLEAAWGEARKGSFHSCLITGPAGIGKSSLVRRFATTVTARGAPVLIVTCQEIGASIPFAAVADLIRGLARDPALGGTDPMWLAEANRVYPALKSAFPGIPEPPSAPAESVRFRVAEALFRMLETVSDEGPALLAFDDIQHMDPASREILYIMARRLEAAPVLFLGASRTLTFELAPGPAEGPSPIAWGRQLAVGALQGSHVLELIARASPEGREPREDIRAQIVALAQGNPYFAEMLVQDWRRHAATSLAAARAAGDATAATWRPPETMRLAFARQFEGLATDPRDLLDALAIAGRAMAPQEAAALLQWDGARVDRSTWALAERGVVRFEAGALAFKNELHRAYVYYAMPEDARRYGHARLAGFLGRREEPHDFQRTLERSHHYLRAGMLPDALRAVEAGAELAITHGGPREAEKALQAVAAAMPDLKESRLPLLLAQAQTAQGRYPDALASLSLWTPSEGRRLDVAMAARLRAEILRGGRLADERVTTKAATRAVAAARLARDPLATITALQVQAEVATDGSDLSTLRRAARNASTIASTRDPECKALAELTKGYCLMVLGETQQAAEAFSESAKLLESMSLDTELRRALNGIGICCTDLGQYERAAKAFRRAIDITHRAGDAHLEAVLWANLAAISESLGYFGEAAVSYGNAMRLAHRSTTPRTDAQLCARAAWLAVLLGNFEQGRELLSIADAASKRARVWTYEVKILATKADLHLAQGEPELAWPLAEEAVGRMRGQVYAPAELGGLQRLRMHWIWATRGYAALADTTRSLQLDSLRTFDRFEVEALLEWIAEKEGMKSPHESAALTQLLGKGLLGIIAVLVAVRTCPGSLADPVRGQSSAQLVLRSFPEFARGNPPSAIPVFQ